MVRLCLNFIVSLYKYRITGKTLLDYTNLFLNNDYRKNAKIIHKYIKDKYGKRKCKPWIWTKKPDERRNYLIEEIKDNELARENHKKVCRALYYFELFLFSFLLSVVVLEFMSLLH